LPPTRRSHCGVGHGPRDFYDVAALLDRYSPDLLLNLAAAKDSGFSTSTFIDALRAIARLTIADWTEDGISAADAQRLNKLFDQWRTDLTPSP
jgi:hypothetical protein